MSPARFCVVFFGASLAIAGAVAAFNAVVDPYTIFNAARSPGFNARKPAVATRERMMKAYQAQRTPARAVILGSSRTDLGFDPASAAWPEQLRPVYNLSLVGSHPGISLKYLRHLLATGAGGAKVQTLVLGLDFEAFLFKPTPVGQVTVAAAPAVDTADGLELDERLLVDESGKPNPRRAGRVLHDQAIALLSLDAIGDSLATLASSRAQSGSDLLANGQLAETPFRQNVRDDGAAAVFDQKNTMTVAQYARPHRVLAEPAGAPIRGLQAVQEVIDLAHQHGIAVILAVQPAHVSRLELLDNMGYWDDYEHWKRALTAMTAAARARQQAVTLWDFGGYEAYAQEAVSAQKGATAGMQWFWDPVHYTSALGNVMVARMFAPPEATGYGVRLTPDNLEARLAVVREQRAAFRANNPAEAARLAALCGAACNTAPVSAAALPVALKRAN